MLHRPVREFEAALPFNQSESKLGPQLGPQLGPPAALSAAKRSVDQALADLRAIEDQLEKQLRDLQSYIRRAPAPVHA